MAANTHGSGLDKILGRLEDLDSVNLSILVQRLARERKLQETVFNTIQDGIMVIDTSGIIQFGNAAAKQLIGLKDGDIGHAMLWKLVPDLARSIDLGELPSSREEEARKSSVLSRELEMTYPNHRYVRLYMVPIDARVEDSGSWGYVVVLSDITEERITMEERIESERINSIVRLAAGVAHELGNPLNSLTIHLQLMERKLGQVEDPDAAGSITESLRVCQNEVKRLDGIITHFLDAVRPKEPDMHELDLVGLLEEVLQVQQAELRDRRIEVNVEVDQTIPRISGDHDQIKQVFFNLIKNANDAMAPDGVLTARFTADDDHVFVQFNDTGAGIAEEDLARIFQPYHTTKKEGHGLGMMIVQRIMRDHGGQIGVESREGEGTKITLQFPQRHRRTRLLENKADDDPAESH